MLYPQQRAFELDDCQRKLLGIVLIKSHSIFQAIFCVGSACLYFCNIIGNVWPNQISALLQTEIVFSEKYTSVYFYYSRNKHFM